MLGARWNSSFSFQVSGSTQLSTVFGLSSKSWRMKTVLQTVPFWATAAIARSVGYTWLECWLKWLTLLSRETDPRNEFRPPLKLRKMDKTKTAIMQGVSLSRETRPHWLGAPHRGPCRRFDVVFSVPTRPSKHEPLFVRSRSLPQPLRYTYVQLILGCRLLHGFDGRTSCDTFKLFSWPCKQT